jgi:hypothetical protein
MPMSDLNDLLGLPADAWGSFGRGELRERPGRLPKTIAGSGSVTVS